MNELKIDVFADKVRNLSNAGIEYESEGLKYLYEVAAAAVFAILILIDLLKMTVNCFERNL